MPVVRRSRAAWRRVLMPVSTAWRDGDRSSRSTAASLVRGVAAPWRGSYRRGTVPMTNLAKNVLASLRHDLRAQIGVIIDCCELLLNGAGTTTPGFRDDMLRIQVAGRRLLALVNDLFDADSAEAGALDPASMGSHLRHELRTPLNHIIGYAEMLLEEAEDAGETGLAGDLKRI